DALYNHVKLFESQSSFQSHLALGNRLDQRHALQNVQMLLSLLEMLQHPQYRMPILQFCLDRVGAIREGLQYRSTKTKLGTWCCDLQDVMHESRLGALYLRRKFHGSSWQLHRQPTRLRLVSL